MVVQLLLVTVVTSEADCPALIDMFCPATPQLPVIVTVNGDGGVRGGNSTNLMLSINISDVPVYIIIKLEGSVPQ